MLAIPENVYKECTVMATGKVAKWIESVIAGRLDQIPARGLPMMPPTLFPGGKARHAVNVSTGLIDRLKFEAEDTAFTASRLALACVLEVVAQAVVLPAPRVQIKRHAVPKPVGRPRNTPVWEQRLEERLAMVAADAAMGRWAHYTITGGEIGVNRFAPLDEQGIRDFGEEIAQGRVVQEVIPWHYSEDEIAEWARGWNARGKRLTWAFVGGDCESFMASQEARRRSEIRMMPGSLETLMEIEREEAAERSVFGCEKMYLKLAAKDCGNLLMLAKRDGLDPETVIPEHLSYIVQSAVRLGWKAPKEIKPVLRLGKK